MLSYSYEILYISAQKNTILNKILMTLWNIFILRGEWGSKSMLKKMFYCENCNSMWSGNEGDNILCPDCKTPLELTNVDLLDWRRKTQSEKDAIKSEIRNRIHEHKIVLQKREELRNAQLSKNPQYEYQIVAVGDKDSGEIDIREIQRILNQYSEEGWKLHSAFTNELGKNSSSTSIGHVGSGTNATIDQTILIFERCIDAGSNDI